MKTTQQERDEARFHLNANGTLSNAFSSKLLDDFDVSNSHLALECAELRAKNSALKFSVDNLQNILYESQRQKEYLNAKIDELLFRLRPVEDPKPLVMPLVDDPGVDFCVGAFFGGLMGTVIIAVTIASTIIHYFWR